MRNKWCLVSILAISVLVAAAAPSERNDANEQDDQNNPSRPTEPNEMNKQDDQIDRDIPTERNDIRNPDEQNDRDIPTERNELSQKDGNDHSSQDDRNEQTVPNDRNRPTERNELNGSKERTEQIERNEKKKITKDKLAKKKTPKKFTPPTMIGMPAGLIPDCPGVRKNASITTGSMLRVALVYQDSRGVLQEKMLHFATAHRTIAKEKMEWSRGLVVHAVGWWDSAGFPHSRALATAYAKRGRYVLVTDTLALFTTIYPKSVRLSREIGRKLGELLVRLSTQGLTGDRLQLVGISLGAHVASYAAKHFAAATGSRPARLTGLDPAGPCFRALSPDMRLNRNDAEQVDVIHTNIDGFGIAEPLGDVDVYVNGGEFQPSDVPYFPCLVVCSHVRAVLYWWQAVEHPKKFIGLKCESVQDARLANCYNSTVTNYIGLETRFDRPGIYYLGTSNEFPYFRGRDGLKPENEIYTSVVRSINDDNGFVV